MNGSAEPRLVGVHCPVCGRLWMRFAADGSADLAEIRCGDRATRKHTVRYRLAGGRPVVVAVRDERPDRPRPDAPER